MSTRHATSRSTFTNDPAYHERRAEEYRAQFGEGSPETGWDLTLLEEARKHDAQAALLRRRAGRRR